MLSAWTHDHTQFFSAKNIGINCYPFSNLQVFSQGSAWFTRNHINTGATSLPWQIKIIFHWSIYIPTVQKFEEERSPRPSDYNIYFFFIPYNQFCLDCVHFATLLTWPVCMASVNPELRKEWYNWNGMVVKKGVDAIPLWLIHKKAFISIIIILILPFRRSLSPPPPPPLFFF